MSMKWPTRIAILISAYILVFLETTVSGPRQLLGAQVDLLPVLTVYAGLVGDLMGMSLTAVCGGLWFDTFSMNPLGASTFPLFGIGLVSYVIRDLILHDHVFVQIAIGGVACASVPAFSLVLLWTFLAAKAPGPGAGVGWELAGQIELGPEVVSGVIARPIAGLGLLAQIVIMAGVGALITPLLFAAFERVNRAFNYPIAGQISFRPDREIKRGRLI